MRNNHVLIRLLRKHFKFLFFIKKVNLTIHSSTKKPHGLPTAYLNKCDTHTLGSI